MMIRLMVQMMEINQMILQAVNNLQMRDARQLGQVVTDMFRDISHTGQVTTTDMFRDIRQQGQVNTDMSMIPVMSCLPYLVILVMSCQIYLPPPLNKHFMFLSQLEHAKDQIPVMSCQTSDLPPDIKYHSQLEHAHTDRHCPGIKTDTILLLLAVIPHQMIKAVKIIIEDFMIDLLVMVKC